MPEEGWVLEGYVEGNSATFGTAIQQFPFVVGRKARCGLRVPNTGVSQLHAELDHDGEQVWVKDLGSTNGTYVNRRRIKGRHPLKDGDIIHFASTEFVLKLHRDDTDAERTAHRSLEDLPSRSSGRELMQRLLANRLVDIHFQPIVRCDDGAEVVGWEALGRGGLIGLPSSPVEVLQIAQDCGRVGELSELMRVRAMEDAVPFGPGSTLFLNCHPLELGSPRLVASMAELRALAPAHHLVLEIHEKAVTDIDDLRALVASLAELGIRTAYDDFGAGQARLLELVEATPAFVKFDKAWTRGLDDPRSKQHRMAATMVQMVLDFGIVPVCEGVETADQAKAALDVGFVLGQGYFYGKPGPAPSR